jgi:hypothetical protein
LATWLEDKLDGDFFRSAASGFAGAFFFRSGIFWAIRSSIARGSMCGGWDTKSGATGNSKIGSLPLAEGGGHLFIEFKGSIFFKEAAKVLRFYA